MVSEKMARLPFPELANTFPVMVPSAVNGLLLVPKFAGLMSSDPKLLPINALSPLRAKRREFGEVGRGFSGPDEAAPVDRL